MSKEKKTKRRRLDAASFIERAKKIHGDRYDYASVDFIKTSIKVLIICRDHGVFAQNPSLHLGGAGCGACSRAAHAAKVRFSPKRILEDFRTVHEDRYDYSDAIIIDRETEIAIICKKHGVFKQKPSDHITGRGCKKCSGQTIANKLKKSQETVVAEFIVVHGNRYNYSKVIYVNAASKIIVGCPIHGDFQQIAGSHLKGNGCNKCNHVNPPHTRMTQEEVIDRFREIHNNKYDYSKVEYTKSTDKIIIVCPEHGEFPQQANSHMQGHGCRKCSTAINVKKMKVDEAEMTRRFRERHGNKYDYSKMVYVDTGTNVDIICPDHGVFSQRPNWHSEGQGCPKCGHIIAGIATGNRNRGKPSPLRKTTEQFIAEARAVHGTKFDYSAVDYKTTHKAVKIICCKHGIFPMAPIKHLDGSVCPSCTIGKKSSNIATTWLDYLLVPSREVRLPGISNRPVDGFDPFTNTVYQFHGDFHHGNPEKFDHDVTNPLLKQTYGDLYQRTMEKDQQIIEAGYKLITIWETEWRNELKRMGRNVRQAYTGIG